MTGAMLDAALGYAARRWAVFPLAVRGKTPMIKGAHPPGDPRRGVCHGECGREGHGFHDATLDVETLTRWWTQWPAANVGIALGKSGLDVLDIDPDRGGSYAELMRAADLGRPLVSRTGSGGWHLIYRTAGVPLRANLDYAGLYGIDIKSAGGYIVAPPSVHPNGERYRWEDDDA